MLLGIDHQPSPIFANDFLFNINDLKDLSGDQFISYIMQSSTMCSGSAHTVKLRDKP